MLSEHLISVPGRLTPPLIADDVTEFVGTAIDVHQPESEAMRTPGAREQTSWSRLTIKADWFDVRA